jgi:hypothetical protein
MTVVTTMAGDRIYSFSAATMTGEAMYIITVIADRSVVRLHPGAAAAVTSVEVTVVVDMAAGGTVAADMAAADTVAAGEDGKPSHFHGQKQSEYTYEIFQSIDRFKQPIGLPFPFLHLRRVAHASPSCDAGGWGTVLRIAG